jgi:hypothetical protein
MLTFEGITGGKENQRNSTVMLKLGLLKRAPYIVCI